MKWTPVMKSQEVLLRLYDRFNRYDREVTGGTAH